jgi:predicted oxidoreductase
MNADEVASAFQQLKEEGKVKHFGVSNFLPFQFELLQNSLDFPLITNQLEFSVPEPKAILDGTLDQCQKLNIRPMAWSPLAGGSIFNAEDPKTKRIQTELHKIKDEIGAEGIDQVALAWILQHPSKVLPVLGSLKIQRIQSAVAAEKLQMSREQWFRIYEASNGHRVP